MTLPGMHLITSFQAVPAAAALSPCYWSKHRQCTLFQTQCCEKASRLLMFILAGYHSLLTWRMVVGLGEASFVSLASPLIGKPHVQCQLSCISCIAYSQPFIHDCRPAMAKHSVLLKADAARPPCYSSANKCFHATFVCGVLIITSQHCQQCFSMQACYIKDLTRHGCMRYPGHALE